MNMRQTLSFRKMNGLGNDFVILDAREEPVRLRADATRAIASREGGVGCDQVILLEDTPRADVRMRIFNPDGGEVGACGNATRCVASLLKTRSGREVTIETLGGLLIAEVRPDGLVSVDMGAPRFGWADIPLAHEVADTRALGLTHVLADGRALQDPAVVNVGNPHAIFWVTDADSYDLASFGPALEQHPMFPERANISLAEVVSDTALKLRVWERGAGQTLACGTAACAAAVCASRTGRTGRGVDVVLPGGALHIDWRVADDHIVMTGPVVFEFAGVLHLGEAAEPVRYDRVSAVSPA